MSDRPAVQLPEDLHRHFCRLGILVRDFSQLPLQKSPGEFYITFIQPIEMGAVMWVLLSSGSDQTSVRLCQVLDYSHEECPTQAGFQLMAPCV